MEFGSLVASNTKEELNPWSLVLLEWQPSCMGDVYYKASIRGIRTSIWSSYQFSAFKTCVFGSQCEMATHTCLKHDVLVFISHMITGAMHTVFSFWIKSVHMDIRMVECMSHSNSYVHSMWSCYCPLLYNFLSKVKNYHTHGHVIIFYSSLYY